MQDDDFFNDLESEAEDAPLPSEKSLDSVRLMAKAAAELQSRIERGEQLLSELKKQRYEILERQMPSLMDDLHVPYTAVDGYHMEVVDYYKASIAADDPEDKRESAFKWLESAGGGDIVNNVVTVAFPKEDAEDAAEFEEFVRKKYHNHPSIQVKREKKVPWNRLTSWLKDYVRTPPKRGESKLPVPLDLLNATLGRIVKIKPVKED